MFTGHYSQPYGFHGRRFAHRRHRGGPGRVLPLLAAVFIAKAALRRAQEEHGGHPGRGPWGGDDGSGSYGRWGHGARGRHGGWRHGHGHGHRRDGGLRAEVGALVMLLRDAFRRGALDGRKVDEIRAVLADAQRRIAAILSESGSSGSRYTEV